MSKSTDTVLPRSHATGAPLYPKGGQNDNASLSQEKGSSTAARPVELSAINSPLWLKGAGERSETGGSSDIKKIHQTITGDFSQKYLIETDQDCNFDFRFVHDKPNTTSNVSILILASGHAHINANATIVIENTAPGTNAWLEIKVITRDQAIVTAAPNLEIRNDAVKAGHALSTKRISEEQLFYLMSRGLNRAAAEQLVLDALAEPYRQEGIKLA